jgi:hypothetical protein
MLIVNFQLGPPTHRADTFPPVQQHINNSNFVKYTLRYSNNKNAKKLDKIVRIAFDGFKF